MVESLVLLAVKKSGEIVLGLLLKKFWQWVLSDRHYQRANTFLKMQILILYFAFVLLRTPIKSLPEQQENRIC